LIGFGLNPILGLIGLVGTMLGLFFWKDEWNEKVGLADALLFLTILLCLTNLVTIMFASLITMGVLFELLFLKHRDKQPLVWITAKWILIMLVLLVVTLVLKGVF
jgi:hypothetical protein